MNDFDYDVYQKKRVARGARNRKCGSKTKYVSLPHDKMTQKQWKEKCGPVVSYNMNELRRPMEYGRFKSLPTERQQEYLDYLRLEFSANDAEISKMMGVSPVAFCKYQKKHGLVRSAAQKLEKEERDAKMSAWASFLTGGLFGLEIPAAQQADTNEASGGVPLHDEAGSPVVDLSKPTEPGFDGFAKPRDAMKMDDFSVVFRGPLDYDGIVNSLRFIIGDSATGELTIKFTRGTIFDW